MQNKNSKVWKQAVTIVAVVALTTLIGVAVSAQMGPGREQMGGARVGGPGGHGMQGGRDMMGGPGMMGGPLGMLGRELRGLGVTDEQRQQIRVKMDAHKAEFEAIGKRMIEARAALDQAITAEGVEVNVDAIRKAATAVGTVEADAAVLRAQVRQEVFSVLTPEQKQKAKDLRAQREQRMKEGRERMKEGRRMIKQGARQRRGGFEAV